MWAFVPMMNWFLECICEIVWLSDIIGMLCRRHTDQCAQWAPHEKRPRPSIKKTTDDINSDKSTEQQPALSRTKYQNVRIFWCEHYCMRICSFTICTSTKLNAATHNYLHYILKICLFYCGLLKLSFNAIFWKQDGQWCLPKGQQFSK